MGGGVGSLRVNYGFYFVVSWLPICLVKVQGFSMSLMAGVGAAIYLSYAAGALLGGHLTDRWIAAGATPNRARKTVMVVCHALAAASLAACALGPANIAVASLFVAGLAFGATSPNIFAIGQTLAGPRAAGKWIGVRRRGWGGTAGRRGLGRDHPAHRNGQVDAPESLTGPSPR